MKMTAEMRKKSLALGELLADIDALNREDPPTDEDMAAVARSLGKSKNWVGQKLYPRQGK